MNKIIFFSIILCLSLHVDANDGRADAESCNKALKAADYVQAVTLARVALSSHPDDRELTMCLGRAQGGTGDHAAAVQSLMATDKLSKTPFEHVTALIQLGNQYKSAKAYVEAIASYKQSRDIAHADKNKRFEMIALNLTGETLQDSGDFKSALEAYQQGYKLAANDNERADSHAHMASAYRASGQYEQAIGQQIQTAVLEERSGDLDHYAFASIELGNLYLVGKQYKEADKVFKNLFSVVSEAGSDYWQASVYQAQGRLKFSQGLESEARDLIKLGVALAQKIGAGELAKDIAETESNLADGKEF